MLAGTTSALLRFVDAVDDLISRFEFEVAVDEGDRQPAAELVHRPRCLLLDLKAAAAGDGAPGADVYLLAGRALASLTTAVEAHDRDDPAPWRSCRDGVLEAVATLRRLVEPQLEGELVAEAVPPAASAPRQARAANDIAVHDGGENKPKGEKPSGPLRRGTGNSNGGSSKCEPEPAGVVSPPWGATPVAQRALSYRAKKILKLLRDWRVLAEGDRLTRESIAEELDLSIGEIRRPLTELSARSLTQSKRGCGIWLSTLGVEEAESLYGT